MATSRKKIAGRPRAAGAGSSRGKPAKRGAKEGARKSARPAAKAPAGNAAGSPRKAAAPARKAAPTARKPPASSRKAAGARKTAEARSPASRRTARGSLAEYDRKRDFMVTAEPAGEVKATKRRRHALRFVIQKHAASHLHFDLRLECDGVMKSWAVPKGPSLDPRVRRLAMQVEDHPIAYNTFEGTIPEGEYGGGTVMLWDRGKYAPVEGADDANAAVHAQLDEGKLVVEFEGDRMRGRWTLVRTGSPNPDKPQWLFIKGNDDYASSQVDLVDMTPTSVESGRTMDEIAADADRVWRSNRR